MASGALIDWRKHLNGPRASMRAANVCAKPPFRRAAAIGRRAGLLTESETLAERVGRTTSEGGARSAQQVHPAPFLGRQVGRVDDVHALDRQLDAGARLAALADGGGEVRDSSCANPRNQSSSQLGRFQPALVSSFSVKYSSWRRRSPACGSRRRAPPPGRRAALRRTRGACGRRAGRRRCRFRGSSSGRGRRCAGGNHGSGRDQSPTVYAP